MNRTSRNTGSHRTAGNKKSRKYRIKSKFRFITFIVVVMCICIGLFGAITGFNTSTALTKSNDITIEISAGDTLWDIANEYKNDDTDTRLAVFKICKVNHIQANEIHPGMEITIPEDL